MKAITTLALATLASACTAVEAPAPDNTQPDDTMTDTTPTPPDDGSGSGSGSGAPVLGPASCADILAADAAATDGDYTLYVGGDQQKPWQVYCADMATTPKEYLPLVFVLGDHNFSQYTAGGASPGSNVRTSYLRVRIDPATFAVDMGDQAFSISSGALNHSYSEAVTSMPFGVAMSCGSADGLADIDLRGTPFTIASQFAAVGNGGHGGATLDASSRQAALTGGGFCGWTEITGGPFNPFNAAHGSLQLTYAP